MSTIRYCGCPKCDVVFNLSAELGDKNDTQSIETARCGVCDAVFDVAPNLMRKTDDGFVATTLNHDLHKDAVSQAGNFSGNNNDNDNGNESPTEHADSAQGNGKPAENTMTEIYLDEIENPLTDRLPYSLNLHEGGEPTDAESFSSLTSPSAEPIPEPTSRETTEQTVAQHITDRANPVMTFIWFMVAVGFIWLLGTQVKYFFVPQYAQDATYRDYIVYFCHLAGCALPPRRDPSLFTLEYTRIDLHPTEPGALRVTVKAVNQAEFAQPYPHVQLTLTDRVGRVVGRRTFPPDIYLPTGAENMVGQGQLASIILNLARPHEKAVGFIVDIVSQPASGRHSEHSLLEIKKYSQTPWYSQFAVR